MSMKVLSRCLQCRVRILNPGQDCGCRADEGLTCQPTDDFIPVKSSDEADRVFRCLEGERFNQALSVVANKTTHTLHLQAAATL
jgi:hypothetical protein